jgi:hypothetical protein
MKLIHIYTFVLILVATAHAATFNVTGSCAPVFNVTANDTDFYCGDAPIYVYNVTNVTVINQTNITVVGYNETNLTLWANQTAHENNLTINCLSNITAITTNVCNFSQAFIPSYSAQSVISGGVSVSVAAIPLSFCYQNVSQNLTNGGMYLSPATNESIICTAGVITADCPIPVVCNETAACPGQSEACAQFISLSQQLDTSLTQCSQNFHECNITSAGCQQQLNNTVTVRQMVDQAVPLAVNAQTAPLVVAADTAKKDSQGWTTIAAIIFVGIAGVLVYRQMKPPHPTGSSVVDSNSVTASLERTRQMREKLNGGKIL